jgi:hypothetical protein
MIGSHRRARVGVGWLCAALAASACATGQAPGDDGGDPGGTPDGSLPRPDAGAVPDAGDPLSAECAAALAAAAFDFETGKAGWTHRRMPEIAGDTTPWRFDDWEQGMASNVGPAACHDGSGCWATRLDNNYIACQRAYLVSPPIDLADCAGESLALTFYHWYDFWTDDWNSQTWFDGGVVELSSDGDNWSSPPGLDYPGTIAINPNKGIYECIKSDSFYLDGLPGYVGASAGWEQVAVTIPAELVVDGLLVRFAYSSGVSLESSTQNANNFSNPGWYIDDIAIVAP